MQQLPCDQAGDNSQQHRKEYQKQHQIHRNSLGGDLRTDQRDDEEEHKGGHQVIQRGHGNQGFGDRAGGLQLIDDGENLLATGFTQADIDDLLGEIGGELGEDEEPPSLGKKEDTADGIKCIVGDFSFRLEEAEFEDLMADVREKVGFTQELVCAELKGRLFDEV